MRTRKRVGEALTRLRKARGRTCIDGGERAVPSVLGQVVLSLCCMLFTALFDH